MPVPLFRRKDFLRNNGHLRVSRQLHQPPLPPHRHEFFEIAIVCSGTGIHVAGSFRHRIETGDVLVINSRRSHGYEDTSRLNLVNILVRDDIVHRIGRDLPDVPRFHSLFDATPRRWQKSDVSRRVRLSADNLRQVEDWIDRLEEETSSSAPGSDFIAEAYLALIIAVLVRRTPQRADGPKKSSLGITRALAWIEKNFHQPLRVADLAQQAGMSERTFFREFQRKMNTSPSDYLIQYRIERAAEWLRKSPRTYRISEVSEGCGFGDSNYFSTCFRRLKGCAPREYRGPTPLQS